MQNDIALKLIFSAGTDGQWRVYSNNGNYYVAEKIEDISEAVRKLLLADAKHTTAILSRDSWGR